MSNNSKKILIILGDPVGGIRKHVHDIFKNIRDDKIIFFYAHGLLFDKVGISDLKILSKFGIKNVSLDIKKYPAFSDCINMIKLIIFCKVNSIDLIHGHGAKGGLYARIVGLCINRPCIYTPHGGVVHPVFGLISKNIYRLTELILKKITTLFIFESAYTYENFIKLTGALKPTQYFVNHNGIRNVKNSIMKEWNFCIEDKVNLLVVGVLRQMKGQKTMIEAMKLLVNTTDINFSLHLCGDGPDKESLIQLVDSYDLTSHVFFHGDVEEVSYWYANTNIVIIPSIHESFGYVALEAAIYERPVIASAVGGLLEIIIDNSTGYFFPERDHEQLAKMILKVITSVPKTNNMVIKAKDNILSNFSLDKMISKLKLIYLTY